MDGCPDDKWLGGRGGHIGQNTQIYKGVNQVNRVVIAWYLLKYSVPEVVEGVLPIRLRVSESREWQGFTRSHQLSRGRIRHFISYSLSTLDELAAKSHEAGITTIER